MSFASVYCTRRSESPERCSNPHNRSTAMAKISDLKLAYRVFLKTYP